MDITKDNNRRRYFNIIRNLNLQNEQEISHELKDKKIYSGNNKDTFPLSSLHFELTSKCNAFCKHCYNDSNNIISDRMTPDNWIDFAKYIVDHGGVFENLLSGGEPLLFGSKLLDIMDIFNDDGTIFYLMTNGFLMTPELANRLSKYRYHWLQISIDGVNEEYHDNFRNLLGSWKKAVKAAQYVSDSNIPLKIAHCVTPYNLQDVDSMCELAVSLGAKSIILGGVSLSGRTSLNKEILLSENDKIVLSDKVLCNQQKYSGKLIIKFANSVKSGLLNHSKNPRGSAIIRPNGDIRIDGMAPFVIGNILDDDFQKIWEQKIDTCWNDSRVKNFIDNFNDADLNNDYINYLDKDIYI